MIKAATLFSNVGIGEIMLKDIGVDVIVANELIENRARFYSHIYPDCNMICGDITDKNVFDKFTKYAIENKIDLLIATPPCQGMSTAGKMLKFDDRNSLILHAINAVKAISPNFVVFENVPQQKNTKLIYKGETKEIPEIIINELSSAYDIKYDILDASDYGVPQFRKRLIFIMVKKSLNRDLNFPDKIINKKTVLDSIGELPSFEAIPLEENAKISVNEFYQSKYSNDFHRYHKQMKIASRYIESMLRTPTGHSAFENEIYYPRKKNGERMKGYNNTFKRISWDKPAPTITMQNGNIGSQENGHPGRLIKKGIYSDARVLSILEIMRLMSIPDDWDIPQWASDTLIRSVIGEGVPPLMMREIVKSLIG